MSTTTQITASIKTENSYYDSINLLCYNNDTEDETVSTMLPGSTVITCNLLAPGSIFYLVPIVYKGDLYSLNYIPDLDADGNVKNPNSMFEVKTSQYYFIKISFFFKLNNFESNY